MHLTPHNGFPCPEVAVAGRCEECEQEREQRSDNGDVMSRRDLLIAKLSDEMDPDNAAALVDEVIREETLPLNHALAKIRGHTSYVNPTMELLQGLLQSIERIADAALTIDPEAKTPPKV